MGESSTRSAITGRSHRWLELVAATAIAIGVVARAFARPHAPLWLDESIAGAYAAAPNWASFWQLTNLDLNAPLYYLLLRGWAGVFGHSDGALRSLSFIFSAAAPLAIAFLPVKGLSRAERLTWAAMVALWIPGIGYAQAAKALALSFFLATAQTLAFANLLGAGRPTTRRAAIWVGLSCVAIISHYDIAFLALAQGLIYLAAKRGAAVRTWPAALLIVPVIVEVGRKVALITKFSSAGSTWYPLVGVQDLGTIAAYVAGGSVWLAVYPLLILAFLFVARHDSRASNEGAVSSLALTAVASVLGLLMFVGAGALRPMFFVRYLGPYAPGILLGGLLILRSVAKNERRIAYAAAMTASALCVGSWFYVLDASHPDSNIDRLSYEQASESIMRAGVSQVVFAWDNPSIGVMPAQEADAIGGFFFHRAKRPVDVASVAFQPGDDPNVVLLHTAAPRRAAIIWLWDDWVKGTAETGHRPHISDLDPAYMCHNFGDDHVGALTCMERPQGKH